MVARTRLECCTNQSLAAIVPSEVLNSDFLYYFLKTQYQQLREISSGDDARGGLNLQLIRSYRIPVPPLEVQDEIVRVLDQFTELEAVLNSELEAELQARRRQFAYFRNQLLTFPEARPVRWSTMGDIAARVSSGGTPLVSRADYYEDGTIPWLRTQEVRFRDIWDTEMRITERALSETAAKWVPRNSVIVAISGATAGRSAINKIPLATNQHCCNFEIDPNQANYRYVFHWVSAHYVDIRAMGQGARSDLNTGLIKSVPIALPTLEEQDRITGTLDEFDALVNDLSIGASRRARCPT